VRVLAIDFGEKRLGLAICDPFGMIAQGLATYQRRSWAQDVEYLKGVVREYGVDTILLGWPKNMNGTEGALCQKVGEFALALEAEIPLRYDFIDERLSSAQAERALLEADMSRKKRKGVLDKMAAAIILQDYLDAGAYNIRRNVPWKTETSSK